MSEDCVEKKSNEEDPKKRSAIPFSYLKRERALTQSIHHLLERSIEQKKRETIPDENNLSYRHGRGWSYANKGNDGEFHEAKAESILSLDDVVNQRIDVIDKFVGNVSDEFMRQFMDTLFSVMNEATEKIGNTVKSTGNLKEDMKAALSKIEFGVNKYGKAEAPQMHVGKQVFEKIKDAAQSITAEEEMEWKKEAAKKEKQAVAREAARIKNYRWRP